MAPRTVGGLAREMTHDSHISHENYEFIGIEGPRSTSAFSRGPDLCLRDQDSMVHSGHTLRTTLGGCILESTHIGGPMPSLVIIGEQAHGMAHCGRIQELFTMGRSTPSHAEYPNQILRSGGQDPLAHGGQTRPYLLSYPLFLYF